VATIKWRPTGQSNWQQTVVTLRVDPLTVKRLYGNGSQLFGFCQDYGSAFNFDPNTLKTFPLGVTVNSLYDTLFYDSNKWYLAVYTAALMKYTQNPYEVNPSLLALSPAGTSDHLLYLARGSDGCIYYGGQHTRDFTGGSLGWYNTGTQAGGGLYDPFQYYDSRDLISIANGDQIIYSGLGNQSGIDGRLFIFDTNQKQIVDSFAPLPGRSDAGKIVDVGANQIIGISKAGPIDQLYKFDLQTKTIIFVKDIAGLAFGGIGAWDRRLIWGPDGYIWLFIDNYICRINPVDGSIQQVLDGSIPGNLLFYNNDLYIFGNGQPNVRRVTGLFSTN
jgi:hypothetical protein